MYGDPSSALAALETLLSVNTLVIMFLGTIAGIIMGVLPGFGASQALALFFPFTFFMTPENGVIFFLSVYSAAEYGGSIPAILIRTPGNTSAVVTCIDGYPMAKKGLATRALRISLVGGCVGGILSTAIFGVSIPLLAWVGLQFGPEEMFALSLFGLAIISGFFGESVVWALIASLIGLLLSTVGTSQFSGMRFTFDQPYLQDGIPVIVMIVGVLAIPEAIRLMAESMRMKLAGVSLIKMENNAANWLTMKDWLKLTPSMLRGGIIGTFIGILPGAGATVASLLVYNEEKRWSKRPQDFGTGVEEGVAAPETANNAVVAGTLVPTLALGIPGSASAAILLGLLISKNVVPGPTLFTDHPDFIYVVFIGLILINLMMLVVGFFGSSPFAAVTRVPESILGPFVLLLLLIGTYSFESNVAHVVIAMIMGVVAYVFGKVGIPVVPIVLAYVMGPIMENNFSRALALSHGDLGTFLTRPISAVILTLAVASAVLGALRSRKRDEVVVASGDSVTGA